MLKRTTQNSSQLKIKGIKRKDPLLNTGDFMTIGELITGSISLLPAIFLLLYLIKAGRKWQKEKGELNEELERQSFKLLEMENHLIAARQERVVTPPGNGETTYIPMPQECKQRELRPARGETLLLVESDHRTLFLLGALLKENYNLLYAENSSEALEKMSGSPRPQLIICPVKNNAVDGIELFKRSRTNSSSEQPPFIFITKGGHELRQISSLKEENIDFIAHLSLQRELKERVDKSLSLSSLLDEIYHYKLDRRKEELFDNYCKSRGVKGQQKEVARLIMNRPERTNILLGKDLDIAQNTLRTHIKRIGEKLGLSGKKREISSHLRSICYAKNEQYKEKLRSNHES